MKKNSYLQTDELRNWSEIEQKLRKDEPAKEFDKDDYVHSVMGTEDAMEKQAGALAFFAFIIIAAGIIFAIKFVLNAGSS